MTFTFAADTMIAMVTSVARGFVESVSNRDSTRLRAILSQQIHFIGLTPAGTSEGQGPDRVLEILFGEWFTPSYTVLNLERVDIDAFADQQRVGARLLVERHDQISVVELHAFLTVQEKQITGIRAMSSGLRPLLTDEAESRSA